MVRPFTGKVRPFTGKVRPFTGKVRAFTDKVKSVWASSMLSNNLVMLAHIQLKSFYP